MTRNWLGRLMIAGRAEERHRHAHRIKKQRGRDPAAGSVRQLHIRTVLIRSSAPLTTQSTVNTSDISKQHSNSINSIKYPVNLIVLMIPSITGKSMTVHRRRRPEHVLRFPGWPHRRQRRGSTGDGASSPVTLATIAGADYKRVAMAHLGSAGRAGRLPRGPPPLPPGQQCRTSQ